MPIRPENRFFYPIDWKELSHVIRFGRAKGCCEGCGRPHGQLVAHLGDGRWWDVQANVWRNGKGRKLKLAALECLPADTAVQVTRVYLACAHLDHEPLRHLPPVGQRRRCARHSALHYFQCAALGRSVWAAAHARGGPTQYGRPAADRRLRAELADRSGRPPQPLPAGQRGQGPRPAVA